MNILFEAAPDQMAAAPAPTRADSAHRLHLLVVDDDNYVRELNAGVLIRAGYDVDTVGDSTIAWKILHERVYDLLITADQMPRMTGIEMIYKLRAETMMLPVILASESEGAEALKWAPDLHLDALLAKPFTTAKLLDTVAKVLAAAQSRETSGELFRQCALNESQRAPAKKTSPIPANPPQRILVVDDDAETRRVSVRVLARSGYEVAAVTDGAAGWEALLADSYDLIITDNQMPRMTGVEMIEKLRAARMTLPVIMATGALPVREFARRPWLKPDATLERPFTSDELLQTVKKVLGTDDGRDDHKESLIPKYL